MILNVHKTHKIGEKTFKPNYNKKKKTSLPNILFLGLFY